MSTVFCLWLCDVQVSCGHLQLPFFLRNHAPSYDEASLVDKFFSPETLLSSRLAAIPKIKMRHNLSILDYTAKVANMSIEIFKKLILAVFGIHTRYIYYTSKRTILQLNIKPDFRFRKYLLKLIMFLSSFYELVTKLNLYLRNCCNFVTVLI